MPTKVLLTCLLAITFYGCVQKTNKKTVVYVLSLDSSTDVQKVAIRGGDKPLNWQTDFEMAVVKKNTTYQAIVTYLTGYKFTEVKFLVNDKFELTDAPNRRILFSDKDTTKYEARFNINK